ncbi:MULTISPECIES: hypothetical protein [unclassified Rhizobacter]|uniref:hypothetical protein n=1 Tax=unclassified Rhizobacter TaxID=2640088 RepID=UPI0012FC477A|nr:MULTISPECIES: hypothetical protein [unclassified Rhizobacter]
MSHLHASTASAAWAHVVTRLTWRLACHHLRRMRTLVPPIALLVGGAYGCLAASHFGIGDAAAVLMVPGDLGLAGRGPDALLLFWTLSYALLPLQVMGLNDVSTRWQLIEQLRPLALHAAPLRPGRRNLRYAAAAIAVLALLGIGKILFGSAARDLAVQTPGALLAFLVVNWLLLHLLMAIVTLTTSFFAACGSNAPGSRDTTDRLRPWADSRHASG